MKKTFILLFALVTIFACNKKMTSESKVDKNAITQGTVTYEFDGVKGDVPGIEMMKGSTMKLFLTSDNNRMTMEMMQGLVNMSTFTNIKTTDTQMFMSMMGQKIKIVIPDSLKAEAKKKAADQAKSNNIIYDKNDKKEILGYPCHKATMKSTNGEGMNLVAYVTDKIQIKMNENIAKQAGGMLPSGLTGFPLQMVVNTNGIEITLTAKEFLKTVEADAFTMPTGYKEMSFEEFSKMAGGMKMGF